MNWHTFAQEHPAFVHLPIAAALLVPVALLLAMRSPRWTPTVRFLALAALTGALPALATGLLWGRDLGWIAPHRLLPAADAAAGQVRLLRRHELWALGGLTAGLAFLALHLALRAPGKAGRTLQLLAALAWAGAWGWAGRQGGTMVFQRPAPSNAPLDLRAFYQEQCAACHGADGSGRDPSGVRLSGRDLRDPRWQARRTDAQTAAAVLDGVGDMPGFRDSLSEADADRLVKEVLRPMVRRP